MIEVFTHHIYEYRKGLRNLVLYTGPVRWRSRIEERLSRERIDSLIYAVGSTRINVFFGHPTCVETVRRIDCHDLSRLSAEHDYILGFMLGYDRIQQCARFLERTAAARRSGHRPARAPVSSMEVPCAGFTAS